MSRDKKANNETNGPLLVMSFALSSLYIAFNPNLFGYEIIRRIILIFFVVIAILGSIAEIITYFKNKNYGVENLMIGLILFIFFYILKTYLIVNNKLVILFVDILVVLLLLLSIYSTLEGLYKIFSNILSENKGKYNIKESLKNADIYGFLSLGVASGAIFAYISHLHLNVAIVG